MQRELGITFVHVTHTQLEAIALADLVVVMEKGKIRQAGPARDVYASRNDRYVAEFLGGQNVLSRPGREGQRLKLSCWRSRAAAASQVPLSAGVHCRARRRDRHRGAPRRCRTGAAGAASRRRRGIGAAEPGRSAIEYQGYFVKVMLDTVPATRTSSPTCRSGNSSQIRSASATSCSRPGRSSRARLLA